MANIELQGTKDAVFLIELQPTLADSVGKTNYQEIYLEKFALDQPLPLNEKAQ